MYKFSVKRRWVTKLVARLLAMAALWVRIQFQTSLRTTKMGDISEGVPRKKYGEKKIRVIFCRREKCQTQRAIHRRLRSYFVTLEKIGNQKLSEIQ